MCGKFSTILLWELVYLMGKDKYLISWKYTSIMVSYPHNSVLRTYLYCRFPCINRFLNPIISYWEHYDITGSLILVILCQEWSCLGNILILITWFWVHFCITSVYLPNIVVRTLLHDRFLISHENTLVWQVLLHHANLLAYHLISYALARI